MRERNESDLLYIEIMIDRLSRIEGYLKRFDQWGVNINDEIVMDNLAFQLQQAGEQVGQNKLSEELKEMFSEIDWRKIKGYRNFIAHSYNRKNNSIMIRIVNQEVPLYIEQLYQVRQYLLKEMENGTEI